MQQFTGFNEQNSELPEQNNKITDTEQDKTQGFNTQGTDELTR